MSNKHEKGEIERVLHIFGLKSIKKSQEVRAFSGLLPPGPFPSFLISHSTGKQREGKGMFHVSHLFFLMHHLELFPVNNIF